LEAKQSLELFILGHVLKNIMLKLDVGGTATEGGKRSKKKLMEAVNPRPEVPNFGLERRVIKFKKKVLRTNAIEREGKSAETASDV